LVDAAVDLFGRDGFDATSVQSVVKRAQVTKGSFYHHFESKEALLFEIHERFIDAHLARVDEVLASNLPGDETLRVVVRDVLVRGSAQFKDEIKIFYQERRRLTGDYLEKVLEKRHRFEQRIREVIERGVDDGNFVDVDDPRVASFAVVGMSAWTYHWMDPKRGNAESIGDFFADLLLDGLRPRV
jgi:AcrR family transcriptional regulator